MGPMIRSCLRHPLLHFMLIGASLLALRTFWPAPAPAPSKATRQPIVITAAHLGAMEADFRRRWGRSPTSQELSASMTQMVDDELLYREARVLALDHGDPSVRRRLIEKMRAVSDHPGRDPDNLVREARSLGLDDDVVIRRLLVEKMRILLAEDPHAPAINDEELQSYLDRHREQFKLPEELTFSHVFISESLHGAHLKQDAQGLRARVHALLPSASSGFSDPFLLGLTVRAWSRSRVLARFGKPFADQVFSLPVKKWSSPIESPYGLHIVWVEEHLNSRVPEVASVRPQLVEGARQERAAAQLALGLERLRGFYEIRVEGREARYKPDALAASP